MTGFSNTYGPVRQPIASDRWAWETLPAFGSGDKVPLVGPPIQSVRGAVSNLYCMVTGKSYYPPAFNTYGNTLSFGTAITPSTWESNAGSGSITYQNEVLLNGQGTIAFKPSAGIYSMNVITSQTVYAGEYYILGAWIYSPVNQNVTVSFPSSGMATTQTVGAKVWTWVVYAGHCPTSANQYFTITTTTTDQVYIGQAIMFASLNAGVASGILWGPGIYNISDTVTQEIDISVSGVTQATFPFSQSLSPLPGNIITFSSIIPTSTTSGSLPPVAYDTSVSFSSNNNPYLAVDSTVIIYDGAS